MGGGDHFSFFANFFGIFDLGPFLPSHLLMIQSFRSLARFRVIHLT